MTQSSIDSAETKALSERAVSGDEDAESVLLERYRGRLKRLVGLRIDRRLQGHVDSTDVVQEAMIEPARRLREYAFEPSMPFYLRLRWLTGEKLLNTHRRYLGTQKRDAAQEVLIYRRPMPEANSITLAQQLLGRIASPTQAVMRAELQLIVQELINNMEAIDREILVLAQLRAA